MNHAYVFTHIPKTGGTSLRYHFQKHLEEHSEFIHWANKGEKAAAKLGLKPFPERSDEQKAQAKVILGHLVDQNTKSMLANRITKEVVIFRNPIHWQISRYNQYANAKAFRNEPFADFNEWLLIEPVQSQFDWFFKHYLNMNPSGLTFADRLELIQTSLESFHHVFKLESLDEDIKPIFLDLNIPTKMLAENVTGKFKKQFYYQINDDNMSFLEDFNVDDLIIFKKIKKK